MAELNTGSNRAESSQLSNVQPNLQPTEPIGLAKSWQRLVLVVASILTALIVTSSVVESINQPQIQSRLELYQANVLLVATGELDQPIPVVPIDRAPTAANWQDLLGSIGTDGASLGSIVQKLLTNTGAFSGSTEQYRAFRTAAATQLTDLSSISGDSGERDPGRSTPAESTESYELSSERQSQIKSLVKTIAATDLRLGLLEAKQGQVAAAQERWRKIGEIDGQPIQTVKGFQSVNLDRERLIGFTLVGLWQDQPEVFPGAQPRLTNNLDGWFREAALARLERVTGQTQALADRQQAATARANTTLVKLAIANIMPGLLLLTGLVILVILLVQLLLKRGDAILAIDQRLAWSVPWTGEVVLWVLVVGFFVVGQLAIPVLSSWVISAIGFTPATFTGQTQAGFVMLRYGLMAAGGIVVLRQAVQPALPLAADWFRFGGGRWWLWGLAGYAVAVPLVIGVSLINQLVWQGQGGSNPMLQIVLENRDPVAIACFFLTASVAAPLFEETLFRGFLLPSLTRYVPVWAAIVLSSFVFAIAHLSISEILPLTVLGMILAVVYTRSRSLWASILLHGLWNGGTLLTLMLLGSAA